MTSRRPSGAMQRSDWAKPSPPTGSHTTSAPRPPVSSRTAGTQSSAASSAWSAPAAIATAIRSRPLAMPTIVPAPSARATWMHAVPTPPAAPWTRTASPSASRPCRVSARWAVWKLTTNPAPASMLVSSGSGMTRNAGAAASSAQPPNAVPAATRIPGEKPEPSGAWRTTPATSSPGTNGSGGRIWYSPRQIRWSTKPTPAAWTSISTMPSPAAGSSTSAIPRPDGPVSDSRSSARTAAPYPRDMELQEIVRAALAEDVGSGDATTLATVGAAARARATVTQKAPGVLFGLDAAEAAFGQLDDSTTFERLSPEGVWQDAGTQVLSIEGAARALLTGERVALNLLQRLSGVATMTARYVEAGPGTRGENPRTRQTNP